ncbi:MAG: hypothetical protein OHK0039_35380 [Bacteroidia bacterium]
MRRPSYRKTPSSNAQYMVLRVPREVPRWTRQLLLLALLVAGSNYLTYRFLLKGSAPVAALAAVRAPGSDLYLLDKARPHLEDETAFVRKVRDISSMLDVPPEWLMAVMYAESQFDPRVSNRKGSGAVGLIQFMPTTARDLDVSTERLQRMSAQQQLEYVYLYLQQVRERYGEYSNLADLYLAILYPRARNQDYCYTLYARPSVAYMQNAGLDEDKDGRVTVSDIDRRMRRLFPDAYVVQKVAEVERN